MEDTWRSMLNDQSKYVIVDPQDFMEPIKKEYQELYKYVEIRYYGK